MTCNDVKYQRYYKMENWYSQKLTISDVVESRIYFYIDKILRRVPSKIFNPYLSHVPVLIAFGRNYNIKKILELGVGNYSTLTFLDFECFDKLESLVSIENDSDWAKKLLELISKGENRFNLKFTTKSISDTLLECNVDSFDLVFVDDSIKREDRSRTIETLGQMNLQNAIVIIHDYDMPVYQKAARSFKYRYRFTSLYPNSGVVWNKESFKSDFLYKTDSLIKLLRIKEEIPKDDVDVMNFFKTFIKK